MSDLDKICNLKKTIGEDCFNVLLNSDYRGEIKEFLEGIIIDTLSKTLIIGDRTYKIVNPFEPGEREIALKHLLTRAQKAEAHLGQDDGEYIWENRDDIPENFRGKIVFIFTNWLHKNIAGTGHTISWEKEEPIKSHIYLQHGKCGRRFRLLQRV